jgi:hypothetical protein
MTAKLQYAKVIDRELFHERGSKINPGLDNKVLLKDDPGVSMAFLVLRGWSDDHGTFTEQWRIEGAGGGLVYESLPRELHLATRSHVEKLEDEVIDIDFPYTSDDYACVFLLDGDEVARTRFSVTVDGNHTG